MSETTALARTLSLVSDSRFSGENDAAFIELWLGTKVSAHTRRAYRSEIERFRHAMDKPLACVTMADLQAYAERLGREVTNRRRRTRGAYRDQIAALVRTGNRLPPFQALPKSWTTWPSGSSKRAKPRN